MGLICVGPGGCLFCMCPKNPSATETFKECVLNKQCTLFSPWTRVSVALKLGSKWDQVGEGQNQDFPIGG